MAYASLNGLQLHYEIRGGGRPLAMLHGALLTIDLNSGSLLGPLTASRQVIAVELQGHELLPDAQLAVLPGTTRVGVTRRPGAVLALITPFLDAR
jgi:hypothetical protein